MVSCKLREIGGEKEGGGNGLNELRRTYNCHNKDVSVKCEEVNAVGRKTGDEDGDDELNDANGDEAFGVKRNMLLPRSSVGGVFAVGHRACFGWLRRWLVKLVVEFSMA